MWCIFYIHWMQLECGFSEPAWVAATIRWPTVSPAKKQHGSHCLRHLQKANFYSASASEVELNNLTWNSQWTPVTPVMKTFITHTHTTSYNYIYKYIYIYTKSSLNVFLKPCRLEEPPQLPRHSITATSFLWGVASLTQARSSLMFTVTPRSLPRS